MTQPEIITPHAPRSEILAGKRGLILGLARLQIHNGNGQLRKSYRYHIEGDSVTHILEVGQVWANGKQRREIFRINEVDVFYTHVGVGKIVGGAVYIENFRRWIARTNAKLEGRDGL